MMIPKGTGRNVSVRVPPIPGKLASKTYLEAGIKKPGVGVLEHCIAAGEAARHFLTKIAHPDLISWLGSDLCRLIPLLVAAHDVGKASCGFQYMIRGKTISWSDPRWPLDPKYGTLRHEVESYEFLKEIFSKDLAGIILYHHGYYRQGKHATYYGRVSDDHWVKAREKILADLCDYFGVGDISAYKNFSLDLLRKKYVAGLLVLCDYISSDEKFFPPSGYPISDIPNKVSEAFRFYKFHRRMRDEMPPRVDFEDVFPFPPNEVQKKMAEVVDGPGVYILEYQMGGGKTEAAIYPSLKLYREGKIDGIYFGLPTQLTSNKIFDRMIDAYARLLGKESPRLESLRLIHSNVDAFHDPKKEEDDWYRGNKRAIVDEFGVGTIDQALLSTLPKVKHFFLRTFGLYRKAVILDELHSYDVYTSELIKALIKDLIEMDCVVIILSATLTEAARKEILDAA